MQQQSSPVSPQSHTLRDRVQQAADKYQAARSAWLRAPRFTAEETATAEIVVAALNEWNAAIAAQSEAVYS